MATVYESSIDNEQIDGAFALAVDARFDDLSGGTGQKVFDFNNGDGVDNIWLGQVGNTDDIEFVIVVDGVEHRLVAENAIVEGEYATWRVSVDRDGTMRLAKNSDLLSEGDGAVPEDVDRLNQQIGTSSDPADTEMSGVVLNLKLANYGAVDELDPESAGSPCAVTGETTCMCDKLYPDADLIPGNNGPAFLPDTDPEGDGEWSPVQSLGVVAIHSIVLPDGKVLSFGTNEDGTQSAQFVYTLYDPETGIDKILPNTTDTDIFCSNMSIDPATGNVIIMGGDSRGEGLPANRGVNDVTVFDYRTETIRDATQGEMEFARWYGSTLNLPNGEILHLGGRDENGGVSLTPEVFNADTGFRTLTDATMTGFGGGGYFPHAWVNSRGEVILLEPSGNEMFRMTTEGTGSYELIGTFPFASNSRRPSIMYEEDMVARLADDGGLWVTDISDAVPTWTRVAQMADNRYDGAMVMLADGRIAVSGGSQAYLSLTNTNTSIEVWDPSDNSVEVLAEGALARLYHSSHVLLPDGTIFVGGGGAPGPLTNTNFEIFAPDYLYDETGERANRPDILEAPSNIDAGNTFTMRVQDSAEVARVTVVKSGAMTHSRNVDTKFLELDFTVVDGENIEVSTPNNFVMTPGLYMLFTLDANGVPSRGEMLGVNMADLVETPNFEPTDGTLAVYAIDDDQIDGAFELTVEARFDDIDGGSYQRVFDFGTGPSADNIILSQVSNSADMYFAVFDGATQYSIIAEDVIIEGVVSKWTVNVDGTGYMRMWRNDVLVAEGQGVVPNDVDRGDILVGKSNWAADDDLLGEVRLLEIVNEGDLPEYVHLGLPTATLTGPASVVEGDTGDEVELVYTLDLSAPAQNIVTADIVIEGDATGPAQVVIPTGEQSATITVTVQGDDIFEVGETVKVSLENLSQARAVSVLSATTDIQNDDLGQTPRPMLAEYFTLSGALSALSDVDFNATPAFSEFVSEINQYAGTGAFYTGGPVDQFAARYTGEFRADLGGDHSFFLNSDDGSQLYIDGVLVINNDGLHGPVELSATVNLSAGIHDIEVRFFENGGGAVVDLDWSGPGFARQQMTFETELNEAPTAVNDTAATDGGVAVDIDVLANDTDPENQTLEVTGVGQGANGTVSINGDGTVRYLPDNGFSGTDSFTYDVTDGTNTVQGTVEVDVTSPSLTVITGTNRPERLEGTEGNDIINPLAGWGDVLVGLGGADIFDFSATSADGDKERKFVEDFNAAEGDLIRLGTATIDRFFTRNTDLHIILDGDGDKIVLQGITAFDASFVDGFGNAAPVAVADAYTLAEDGTLNVAAPGVLGNDSDPDGNALNASLDETVTNGQLTFNADGSFTYTPDADFFGSDGFTYTVSDGVGGTATGTVSIDVTPENDPPTAQDDTALGDADVALNINVLGNDSDPDGDALTVTDVSQGANGSVSINGDGTVLYTPDAGFEGTDSFTYQIADPTGATASATVDVTIGDVGNVIIGTHRQERLEGTEGNDIINPLGGWGDILVGLGGADVFDFSTTSVDGEKERKFVEDFNAAEGDLVRLGTASIDRHFTRGSDLHVVLDGDSDKIVLVDVDVFDIDYFV